MTGHDDVGKQMIAEASEVIDAPAHDSCQFWGFEVSDCWGLVEPPIDTCKEELLLVPLPLFLARSVVRRIPFPVNRVHLPTETPKQVETKPGPN